MAQRRRRSKKWISWLILVVLLIAAIIVGYQVWNNYFNDDGEAETSETEEKEEEIKNNESKIETNDAENDTEEKKEVIPYDGGDPNNNQALTGVVTYAAVSGANLLVRVNIDQYVSGGSCRIELLNDNRSVYSDNANIIEAATTATCEGFNIPVSQLSSGNYKIVINLESGDKTGVINGEVNI